MQYAALVPIRCSALGTTLTLDGTYHNNLHITITSDGDTLSSSCDNMDCFKQCEADGAIGGVCEGSKGCECAYSGSKFHVQKDGARVRLAAHTCDLDLCNEVCYQKGGFAGGVCREDDGSCMCVEQTGKWLSSRVICPFQSLPWVVVEPTQLPKNSSPSNRTSMI